MNKPTYVPEYQAIVEVLNKYSEGCKQAQSSIMKPAFSEQATMFSVDGDGKLTGGRSVSMILKHLVESARV
ncbi:MAG: hypothetical protein ABJA20_16225 [Novosphingobium sp.]